MGKRKTALAIPALPRHYSSAAMLLTLAVGIVSAVGCGVYVAHRLQEIVPQRVQDIANSLPADSITALSGSIADTESPAYESLQTSLKRIQSDNRDLQAITIIGIRNNQLVSLVRSDETTPGTPLERDALYPTIKSTDTTFFAGPHTTSDGNMAAGFAPVIESETGHHIATLAVEFPATVYYRTIATAVLLPLALISIPLVAIILERRAQRQEEEITRLKTQFISVASHELRSPLGGMLWAVQSLLKPSVKNLTIEQQVILLDMYQSAEESLATINEILDMSAMERNDPTRFVKKQVDVSDIVKTATKTLRLSANERGLKFNFVSDWADTECLTIGDPSALKRMFMNIIGNAIKYGKDNTEISLRHTIKADTHVIAIEDHGIGIPQADQERVLQGYYRAQNARETQRAGTGLGLLLAKLVAEQHDGKLWLNSKENKGTTIYVSLPDAATKKSSEPTA